MKVTLPEILHGIGRLLEIYARPRHLPDDVDAIGKIWHRELGDLDADVFRAGISAFCRTDAEYFPKPGVIRKLGEAVAKPAGIGGGLAAEYARWEKHWPDAPTSAPLPCPVCGAVAEWNPRLNVPHDHDKHVAAGVGYSLMCPRQARTVGA